MSLDTRARGIRLTALALCLALGASLLVAACGSSGPATTPGVQPTAAKQSAPATSLPTAAKTSAPAAQTGPECPVLTKQEVETALGTSVLNADILITEGSLISCSYRDPKRVARILVGVMVQMGSQAKLGYQTRKAQGTAPKAIAGLGDDAFWEESDDDLEVLKGDNALVVTIDDGAVPDRPTVAQDLATKVLGKLAAATSSPAQAKAAPATGQTDALEPCSLLTREEVEAVVGKPVDPVKTTTSTQLFSCSYQDPARKPQAMVDVTVLMATPSQAKGLHEATKGGGRDQSAVPGLGDDAYWERGLGGSLYVLKGRYAVSISVDAQNDKERMQAAQTLAPKVLSRLP